MFLTQPIMISLKAIMEIKEHNPHCQVQSWSLSVNQTIDSYKKSSTYIIASYFLFCATCNWFLLPFLCWRFSTTIKRSNFLIENCDQFISHQNKCVSSTLCTVWSLLYMTCVPLFSELFCIWSLCLFLVRHVNVKHF